MDTSTIVAVASSAGDSEAVSELLSALRGECGAAFIVVQHLDSGRERLLFEVLGSSTILPVIHAHDGLVVEQGRVYVITANTTMTMRDFLAGVSRRRSILLSVDSRCGVTSPQEPPHGVYTGRSPRFIHAGGYR